MVSGLIPITALMSLSVFSIPVSGQRSFSDRNLGPVPSRWKGACWWVLGSTGFVGWDCRACCCRWSNWCGFVVVISLIGVGPFQRGEEDLLLKDVIHNRDWSLGGLSFAFPPTIWQKIKATPFPLAANSMDHIIWASSPNGNFELKEAYKLACLDNDNYPYGSFTGQWVWKTITLPKIKCFLWKCLHKSIPAREVLATRGLNVPLCCPICNSATESILHMLSDCPQVRAFWDSFPPPIHSNLFYGGKPLGLAQNQLHISQGYWYWH
ncbi:hypothetical protein SO802_015699 [Lithocarpus litseifolius]|uniref:Reverse transcriptase zinc-binding domain-containing protein n=1 Tax=Lithocarpus litseifolius TaxID=425828 RepID=A0AAW2CWI4_9ROSI